MMFLNIFVLIQSWCIVWPLIVFSQAYSYDVLYILSQYALRIDESEISYVCYVSMYILTEYAKEKCHNIVVLMSLDQFTYI